MIRPRTRGVLRCMTVATAAPLTIALLVHRMPSIPTRDALTRSGPLDPDVTLALITGVLLLIAIALLAYLTLSAVANLALAARRSLRWRPLGRWPAGSRSVSLDAVGRRVAWAPRWLAITSVGAAGALLVPATASATVAGDRRNDVLLEVVEEPAGAPADAGAPRTMLPWAATTTTATTPTTLPDPPRLRADDSQLPPPLVVERPSPPVAVLHRVAPGEHFWSIAEQVVTSRGLDVSVADYWRLLVEANRDRLVVPDDPNLLYPGQELVLP